jgi:hypothetical protein
MDGKVWLAAMVAGSMVVIAFGSRRAPAAQPEPVRARAETPWLTRELAAEVIGPGGNLGPLFTGVILGGTPPLPAVRARIAEFARAHDVEIALEIADDELRAIRFEVTYSGCCGYEGADTLANRMNRPSTGGGCLGGEPTWIDDWSATFEDGVHMRASVRVNRVIVRWERAATFGELLEKADSLLGSTRMTARHDAHDRWTEVEAGRVYKLEVPYPGFGEWPWGGELGMDVTAKHGRIAEVSFEIRNQGDALPDVPGALKAHWGRPQMGNTTWTWRTPDRIVRATFDPDYGSTTIALRAR